MGNTINLLEAPTIAKRHNTMSDQIKSKSGLYYEAERATLQAELSCSSIFMRVSPAQQEECTRWRLIDKLYHEKNKSSRIWTRIRT